MTATVSAAPLTSPPNKYGGDPVAFDAAMQAHLDWQAGSLVTELNAQNAENNAINANINAQTATLLGAGLANAEANALAAAANAATATAQNSAANTYALSATASAAAAAVSADRAATAWAVASEPAEAIAGKSQILHQGTIVASCIDLPSKHSDGGAWIDRCSDKSWYNETLGGDRWIGTQATVAAAWTAAGSATGGVYQSTADNKFYTPTSSSTATEVFRGIKREYPRAGVVWIAEAARVVGYDLGSGAMWMVFTKGTASWAAGNVIVDVGCSSVDAADGVVALGNNNGIGAATIDFVSGTVLARTAGSSGGYYKGGISQRNAGLGFANNADASRYIVNATVNSVAITVLPNAVSDPATNLPTPTIVVGTAGGMSVIANSGTVYNSSSTSAVSKVAIDGNQLTTVRSDGTVSVWNDIGSIAAATVPNTTYNASSVPAMLGTAAVLA